MNPETKRKSNLLAVKAWQRRNPEKVVASAARRNAAKTKKQREESARRSRARRAANPERVREQERMWRQKNLGAVHARVRAWWKAKYYSDHQFRLATTLRNRLGHALRGASKSQASVELLGCPLVWLEVHLESLFKPGMTWENYGPVWHVDHLKPCAKFDLTDPEQQRICFHWTNLQPLFAAENRAKGAK